MDVLSPLLSYILEESSHMGQTPHARGVFCLKFPIFVPINGVGHPKEKSGFHPIYPHPFSEYTNVQEALIKPSSNSSRPSRLFQGFLTVNTMLSYVQRRNPMETTIILSMLLMTLFRLVLPIALLFVVGNLVNRLNHKAK